MTLHLTSEEYGTLLRAAPLGFWIEGQRPGAGLPPDLYELVFRPNGSVLFVFADGNTEHQLYRGITFSSLVELALKRNVGEMS